MEPHRPVGTSRGPQALTAVQLDPIHRARVEALLASGRRSILGLAGPPGCGKSTLAQALAATFPRQIQIVPRDGFHLASAELERLGRAGRKGVEDTFDSAGFVALLRRIRAQSADETIYAPEFHTGSCTPTNRTRASSPRHANAPTSSCVSHHPQHHPQVMRGNSNKGFPKS